MSASEREVERESSKSQRKKIEEGVFVRIFNSGGEMSSNVEGEREREREKFIDNQKVTEGR